MRRITAKSAWAVVLLAIFIYVADFCIWSLRGPSAMSSVAVDQYLATPLKGNKAEYDYIGTVQQPCARALVPHAGAPPCWWLSRHTSHWE
jgi:hypothetical protein